ncbi:MAG: hypothetical protein HZC54_05140 [Verrucomicrobia bacterium]|nr:hypothetical protein [Verrucomicrobiota bacterium]
MLHIPRQLVLLVCCAASAPGQSPANSFTLQLPASAVIEPGSAADVSALAERPVGAGRPAGIHGFLKTAQDRFEFADGQPIRFWGLNWPADHPVPAGSNAVLVAKRLVQQGFNVVRLPLPAAGHAQARGDFEQFAGCLRNQGVYLDLLLPGDTGPRAHTNRVTQVAPGDDAGIALIEVAGPPQNAAAARRSEPHMPLSAAGPVRTTGDIVARQGTDFVSQTVAWERGVAMVKSQQTIFGPMSFGGTVDRPLLVGAWSAVAANPFRAELPLWVAAVASFQQWAGVCVAHDARAPASPAAPLDVVTWAWAPACALMFQRGDAAPAKGRMLFRLDPGAPTAGVDEAVAAIAGIGMTRFSCEAAFTNAPGWLVLNSGGLPGVAAINPRTADTGEIVHDWQSGRVRIDTPRTQAVIGFFENKPVETRDLRLTLANGAFAAVALTSLDGEPLSRSQRVLLTATGRADPSGAPRLEPVAGEVTLRSLAPSQRDRRIFALDLTGRRLKELPLVERGFKLQPELNVAWYEVIAESGLPKPAANEKEAKSEK